MINLYVGITKLERIISEKIRDNESEGNLKEDREMKLEWYGLVRRREEHCVGRRAMEMAVQERKA